MVASGMGYLYLYLCLFLVLVVLIVVRSEASFAAAVNDNEGPSSPRVLLFWITTVHAIRRTMMSSISFILTVSVAMLVWWLVVVLAAFFGEDFVVVLC